MPDLHLDLLDRVSIASPCSAQWEDMSGDDVTRHCASCNLDVHNLSAMTRAEANAFLQSHTDGRICARFYRRLDGTVITQDCPVGIAGMRARMARTAGRVAAALVLLIGGGVLADQSSRGPFGRLRLRTVQPIQLLAEKLFPAAPNLGPMPRRKFRGFLGGASILALPPLPSSSGPAGFPEHRA
jgi:hypothetical protein